MDKKKMRRNLIFSLMLVITLVVSISSITLGWFVYGNNPKVGNISSTVLTAVGFKISYDEENYSSSYLANLPENVNFEPVSGDGERMYIANMALGSNDPTLKTTTWKKLSYSDNVSLNSYYKVRVYFKADKKGYIALTEASVAPIDTAARKISSTLNYRITDNSKTISKDYIACASRICIINYTESGDRVSKYIIIPMDKYNLSMVNVAEEDEEPLYDCSISEDVVVDENAMKQLKYYNGSGIGIYNDIQTQLATSSSLSEETIFVGELSSSTTHSGSYTCYSDIIVWIDGFDNEAIDLFAGGQIKISIKFTYMEINA